MQSQEFQSKLEEASLHDNVNIATELVSQTLVAECKTAGLKFQKQKSSYKQRKHRLPEFQRHLKTERVETVRAEEFYKYNFFTIRSLKPTVQRRRFSGIPTKTKQAH